MRGGGAGRLRHRVGQAIEDRGLWSRADRVAVAVSGGLDSVSLLDLLHVTAKWHGAELSVVTVDHGMRVGSAADAGFVEGLGRDLGLPVRRFTLDLGPHASEAEARDARLACFAELDVDGVAVAHHLDDQAETVLLHLMRGTGTAGLAGMGWRHPHAVHRQTVTVLRPLLEVRRSELLGWAQHRSLSWRDDPSNGDLRYLRNRIRHQVLPALEGARHGAIASLARSARLAGEDDRWLSEQVAAEPLAQPGPDGWSASWLGDASPAMARRALRAALPELTTAHVDAALRACRAGQGAVGLAGRRSLRVVLGRLVVDDADPGDP